MSLIDSAFEEEEPYYVNPIIRIDYIYTYFDIDRSADVSSSYYIDYIFPIMYFEDYSNVYVIKLSSLMKFPTSLLKSKLHFWLLQKLPVNDRLLSGQLMAYHSPAVWG